MELQFTKMQAYGNDYVYLNAISQEIGDPHALARRVSERHFGIGSDGNAEGGWLLSLYSLICIFVASRVIDYVIDGASYDKLLFIISNDHSEQLREYIIRDMDRSATYLKASGMYSKDDKEMIFLVVSRREVAQVQRKIKEIDPRAFLVVTDAYDTYGEGFKPFPDKETILAD